MWRVAVANWNAWTCSQNTSRLWISRTSVSILDSTLESQLPIEWSDDLEPGLLELLYDLEFGLLWFSDELDEFGLFGPSDDLELVLLGDLLDDLDTREVMLHDRLVLLSLILLHVDLRAENKQLHL